MTELEIIALRKEAQLNGLFETKKGITIFYTTYLGMDIDDALPKIKTECECRDIPFEVQVAVVETPKTTMQKMEEFLGGINAMTEKYPIVKETVMPIVGQILATGVTTIAGVITGNKIAENNDQSNQQDYDLNNLEIADVTDLETTNLLNDENLPDDSDGSVPQ